MPCSSHHTLLSIQKKPIDNAPVRKNHVAMAALQQVGFEILPHPTVLTLDLAPSLYNLIQSLKNIFCKINISSDEVFGIFLGK